MCLTHELKPKEIYEKQGLKIIIKIGAGREIRTPEPLRNGFLLGGFQSNPCFWHIP